MIGTIDVPDRPIDLEFGGKNGRTLFNLAWGALHSVETRFGGTGSIDR
jgi:hypothetical protein